MRAAYKSTAASLLVLVLTVGLSAPGADKKKDDKQNNGKDGQPEEQVYDLGEGIAPPRVVYQINPAFAGGSRGIRIVGSVAVGMVVSSEGLPKDLHIVRGLDKDIDQSALEAMKQWRFDPARKDGKAIAVRVTIEIHFRDM
jgi:protein TonB